MKYNTLCWITIAQHISGNKENNCGWEFCLVRIMNKRLGPSKFLRVHMRLFVWPTISTQNNKILTQKKEQKLSFFKLKNKKANSPIHTTTTTILCFVCHKNCMAQGQYSSSRCGRLNHAYDGLTCLVGTNTSCSWNRNFLEGLHLDGWTVTECLHSFCCVSRIPAATLQF